jgi:hypothetical protein
MAAPSSGGAAERGRRALRAVSVALPAGGAKTGRSGATVTTSAASSTSRSTVSFIGTDLPGLFSRTFAHAGNRFYTGAPRPTGPPEDGSPRGHGRAPGALTP